MSTLRIAIIGAGPGGLTLASILQHNGMQCTIFELDQSRSSRDQGGIVDIHLESGQMALREAGLFKDFQKHSLAGAETQKVMKSDGRVFWDENDTKGIDTSHSKDRPEIDRSKLRDILLDSIEPETIRWNKKLVSVEAAAGSTTEYNLHFTDSVEEGFDLVVGADGAWSRVRPLLTDQKPFYSGISGLELKAVQATTKKPWLSDFTGHGSLFMFDEGRAMVCQQNGNDTIRVYVMARLPETWISDCGIDLKEPDIARKTFADRYFGDCHEDIMRVITTEASDGLIPRALYMLPVGLQWPARAGVTLLGDAAHLMTPFAGVGVNVALADALGLAKALLKRKDAFEVDLHENLADVLREYEEEMFARGKESMEKTWIGLQHHFSFDGVDQRVGRLRHRVKLMEERKKAQQVQAQTGQ